MTQERTLAIIKPDAVAAQSTGAIIELIELNGFSIERMEKRQWTSAEAELFYDMHKARSFFPELVSFMTSGPSVFMLLSREGAVVAWRDLMGATNPAQAHVGTIRAMFGTDVGENATHGSDSAESATREIKLVFSSL
jgi:nucleoside-diphosphate kinase